MIQKDLILFWLLTVNITLSFLLFFSWRHLPPSNNRLVFISFLIPYGVWANSLFVIQLLDPTAELTRSLSQIIFASGAFYHTLLGYLLVSIANSSQTKTPLFCLLALNTVIVGALAFTGAWEQGITFNIESGLAPIPTDYLWYFNVSLLVWAVYYFLSTIFAYRQIEGRTLIKCQLHVLVLPAIFSMTMSLTTNVIIPALTGNYSLSAIGGFWLFVFFAAIASIIKMGREIVIYQTVKDIDGRLPYHGGIDGYEELGALVKGSIARSRAISWITSPATPHS